MDSTLLVKEVNDYQYNVRLRELKRTYNYAEVIYNADVNSE